MHWENRLKYLFTAPFNNTRILKFKTWLTIAFLAGINHKYDDNQRTLKKKEINKMDQKPQTWPERFTKMIDSKFACHWKAQDKPDQHDTPAWNMLSFP